MAWIVGTEAGLEVDDRERRRLGRKGRGGRSACTEAILGLASNRDTKNTIGVINLSQIFISVLYTYI